MIHKKQWFVNDVLSKGRRNSLRDGRVVKFTGVRGTRNSSYVVLFHSEEFYCSMQNVQLGITYLHTRYLLI